MRKYWPLIPVILLFSYLVFKHYYNRYQILNLHYGIKANDLRSRLHVPIIDNYMKAERKYDKTSGHRWKAEQELPSDNEVLHVWKIASPFSDSAGLWNEIDAFRKRYNDSLFYQFNIHSEINGDTAVKRSGRLFIFDKQELLDLDLNDKQVDSVAKRWGLTYLVR